MDLDTQLIAAAEPTPASVDETTVADRLLSGRARSMHADRAADAAAREALYAERGIEYAIMRRGNRHHPLPERERNRRLSRRPGPHCVPRAPAAPYSPRTASSCGPPPPQIAPAQALRGRLTVPMPKLALFAQPPLRGETFARAKRGFWRNFTSPPPRFTYCRNTVVARRRDVHRL